MANSTFPAMLAKDTPPLTGRRSDLPAALSALVLAASLLD